MPKKAAAAEPEPEPTGVKVELKDADENATVYEFYTEPSQRDRLYFYGGLSYAASRQNADGSWIYRQEPI